MGTRATVTAAACIPTIGVSPFLGPLLDVLAAADVHPILWCNGTRSDLDRLASFAADLRWRVGTIYQEWNEAMDAAVIHGRSLLLVLNDDVILTADSVRTIVDLMTADPAWTIVGFDHLHTDGPSRITATSGTFRDGGVPGFAFAVRPDRCPRVDERFRWWGGDDDLVWTAEAAGQQVGRAVGAAVDHPHPSLSAHQRPEVLDWIDQDRALLASKWGRTW
jgi:GT2 family glycosyltransferase